MSRRVVISGLGPVSGAGLGIEPTWQAALAGRSAIGPIRAFDPGAFPCRIGAEVPDLKVQAFVPKSYRKAVKVMARDIELAVAAADLAARDARLVTKGTVNGESPPQVVSYPNGRVGAHIGAGLIATDLNELVEALDQSRDGQGLFDIHRWGREGMNQLTPLWLLKYLPNMLACHVTIIDDAQGPSNTITCTEASSGLSIGESLRVIQRGGADACFCGGIQSPINPMEFTRQHMSGRLNLSDNDRPQQAVRPFCKTAGGTVVGEGGAIVILEALETFKARRAAARADPSAPRAYAEAVGFGASQTVCRESRNLWPDPEGRAIASAIRAAIKDSDTGPDQIDLIVPFGSASPAYDLAEAAALHTVFGARLSQVPLVSFKPLVGNAAAGAGGLDICLAARAIFEQMVPATINCVQPRDGLRCASAPAHPAAIGQALVFSTGIGGQNAALVLRRITL